MKRRTLHLLFASSLCVLAPVARAEAPANPPAEQAPSARDRLVGSFAHAGGQKDITARDAAIDKATDSMFFAIKGVARSKLREKTPVRATVGIAFSNGNIVVSVTGEPAATSPENGSAVAYKNADGQTSKLSQKLTADGKLVQTFAGENGTRTNALSISPDGKTLTMAVSIESSKLPQAVRYTLTYRRS